MIRFIITFVGWLSAQYLNAQAGPYLWGTLFSNGAIRGQWGFHLDAQVRSEAEMTSLKTWLVRPGVQYQVNKRNLLTVGYAYVHTRVRSATVLGYTSEHRLWQQWIHQQPIKGLTWQHRFRLEQRFIGATQYREGIGNPGTSIYSTRFRYFNRLVVPWQKQRPFTKGAFGAIQNELFLHLTGKDRLNEHTYDQNRFLISVGYRPNRQWDAELGYMLRNIQGLTGSTNQHTWQLAVYLRPE